MFVTALQKERNNFLYKIVTGNESWIHHYDPKLKNMSMEYCHPSSPKIQEAKKQARRFIYNSISITVSIYNSFFVTVKALSIKNT